MTPVTAGAKGSGTDGAPYPYDALARAYETDQSRQFYLECARTLAVGLEPALGHKGLDLGCGTGISLEVLLQKFPEVSWTGLDVSKPMLARARSKSPLRDTTFLLGRAEALPFASESFDVVVCCMAFHWFRAMAVAEILRILRPEGIVAMVMPRLGCGKVALGNRLLRNAIISQRGGRAMSFAPGIRESSVRSLFEGWHDMTIESLVVAERFSSVADMANELYRRGSLIALFGKQADAVLRTLQDMRVTGSVPFEWPLLRLKAQKRGIPL